MKKRFSQKIAIVMILFLVAIIAVIVFSNQKDFDGDRIPDCLDRDMDNDGISNSEEGDLDIDNDGLPNKRDHDSDGDGLSDEDEYYYLDTHYLKVNSFTDNKNESTEKHSKKEFFIKSAHAADASKVTSDDHDGSSKDGDDVAEKLEDHPNGYFYNKDKKLYEVCKEDTEDKCYYSSGDLDDGPVVQDLVQNLNKGTYKGKSEVLILKDKDGKGNNQEKTYVDYIVSEKNLWYAEIYRFKQKDDSYIYLFKHTNPRQKGHWDYIMDFEKKDKELLKLATDANGWVILKHSDSGSEVAERQNFDELKIEHLDWEKKSDTSTWKGEKTIDNVPPYNSFMTPSPLVQDGKIGFCRTVYSTDLNEKSNEGILQECPEIEYNSGEYKATTFNLWMTEHYPALKDKKFKDIVFPGTHDTGAYTLSHRVLVQKFGQPLDDLWRKKTQNKNIYEQLALGIRLQDWRLYYDSTADRFFLFHNGIGPAVSAPTKAGELDESTHFSGAFHDSYGFRQVRAFMDKVKDDHELVIISLANNVGVDSNNFKKFRDEANLELGDYIYKTSGGEKNISDLYDKTLHEIVGNSSKVIFIIDDRQYANVDSFADNTQGFWASHTKDAWADKSTLGTLLWDEGLRDVEKNFLKQSFGTSDFVNLNWVRTAVKDSVKTMTGGTNGDLDETGWVEKNIPKNQLHRINSYTVDYPEIGNAVDFGIRLNLAK